MANITIRYNNEVIAELNNLGSLTMKTAGHSCIYDIELDYINYCPRTESTVNFYVESLFNDYILSSSAVEVEE